VLALLQADCAAPWTLERMAEAAGLSRTALAERFRAAMADTPLAHLRTLRVQRAMRMLAESDMALERIAREVGYGDAFGFSKAFKRVAGVAPSAFRRRARAEAEGSPAARRGTG
jgi:transcriptional regulator GlxA family with amidase domain